MWDEIMMLRPIPICKCDPTPAYTCDVMKTLVRTANDELVMKFVKGMDDSFESIRSMTLVTLPLTDVKSAFNMASNHKRQQTCGSAMSQVMCIQEMNGKFTQVGTLNHGEGLNPVVNTIGV